MTSMTPIQRVTAVLQHEIPDCVPVFPSLLMQGAREMNLDLERYFSRAENMAEGQLRLLEKFGHDCVFGVPHLTEDITAFGAPLLSFRNGPPSVGGLAIRSFEEARRLAVPDPLASPVLVETLRTIAFLADEVKDYAPVIGACIAPFSLPSMLMGTEQWMELLFLETPETRDAVLNDLMPVMIDFVAAWANAQLDAGADAIILADGMASGAVITRQQFIDLALPVVTDTLQRINGPVIHEGVGHLRPMLDLLVGLGLSGVMITSEDDMARARTTVGDDLILIGNLNNVAMRRWSAQDTAQQAEIALNAGAQRGGMILANQGPDLPYDVPDEAIHALVAAGHNWRY